MVTLNRNGPTLTIVASCFDCAHLRSERYEVQGDSGTIVYCAHPKASDSRRRIGDTMWDTPPWCPLLPAARAALAASLEGEEHGDG